MRFPLRALIIGTLFAAIFSYVAVLGVNRLDICLPATQLSSLSIVFAILLVLLLNPILKTTKLRVLNKQELFLIFIMATVPAGMSVFGIVGNSLPFLGALNNPEWNTSQSQFDAKINPIADQSLFVGDPLFEFRDVNDWQKFAGEIVSGESNPKSPEGRVWELLASDGRELLKAANEGRELTFDEKVSAGLSIKNVLLKPDFYDAAAFSKIDIPDEAQKLIDVGILRLDPKYEITIINRLLMEASFPDTVRKSQFVEGRKAIKYYNRGMRAAGMNSYPIFIMKDDESVGDFIGRIYGYVTGKDKKQTFWGDIPWGPWISPLIYWGMICATFLLLFYALNELVFKQWYENEKLVFPIAELASAIVEPEDENKGTIGGLIPAIYKNSLFWVGFAISFLIIFYNGMVTAKWFEGLDIIDLRGVMDQRLKDTFLEAIIPQFRFEVFFACIGLAFLLPVEISFSAWFFFLFMRFQQFIAVALGYGVNGGSFPSNWLDKANFMTAQGGGAMEVFGFICLWKVRHQVFAFFYRLARPNGVAKFSKEQIKEYSLPSFILFIATALAFYFLRRGGVSWGMCFLTYFSVLFMTISMVRLVAECGIIGFQINWGALHMLKMFKLFRFTSLFHGRGLGTALTLISGMFIELKTFIAPTMMNGKFLAEKSNLSRRNFVIALVLCLGVTMVVATFAILAFAYDQGVGAMNNWFFVSLPKSSFFNNIEMVRSINVAMEKGGDWFGDNAAWFGVGAVSCAFIVYLRQFLFWVPHPIGLVMVVNPLMRAYWFSFFVAWLCKRAAVKYCDPDGYKFIRGFFIGLIIGEIIAVAVASLLGIWGFDPMNITLNKN